MLCELLSPREGRLKLLSDRFWGLQITRETWWMMAQTEGNAAPEAASDEQPNSMAPQVFDGRGYLWIPREARWMREKCRMVGATVGGVAGYQAQNAVTGLPLQMCAEELRLAESQGWLRDYDAADQQATASKWEAVAQKDDAARAAANAELVAAAAAEAAAAAAKAAAEAAAPKEADGKAMSGDVDGRDTEKRAAQEAAAAPSPKRPRTGPGQFAIEAAEEEGARAAGEGDALAQGPPNGEAGAAVDEGIQDDEPQWLHKVKPAGSRVDGRQLFWACSDTDAASWNQVKRKKILHLPVYPATSEPIPDSVWLQEDAAQPKAEDTAMTAADEPVRHFDCAESRAVTFQRVHEKGYYLTNGSKFGAEYLVYPGDPFLFHAQFTGHLVDESEILRPCLLAGTARGSHSARKHLLFLIKGKDGSQSPHGLRYLSFAPEAGFGTASKDQDADNAQKDNP